MVDGVVVKLKLSFKEACRVEGVQMGVYQKKETESQAASQMAQRAALVSSSGSGVLLFVLVVLVATV
jgi:hypothetical protein